MEELTTPKKKTNKIDYATTPISFYKFVCNDESVTSTYVGHTANFTRRKGEHKKICNNVSSKAHNFKLYQTMREHGGWYNWKMIEIQSQLCESKRYAEKIEQDLIEQCKSKLNSNKAFGAETIKEYQKEYKNKNYDKIIEGKRLYEKINKTEIQEKQKQYYIDNKEDIILKRKVYLLEKKEDIALKQKQYRINNKEKIEQYRIDNREKILEQRKQYRLNKKLEKANL